MFCHVVQNSVLFASLLYLYFCPTHVYLQKHFQDEVTSTQRSASSAAWPLPNDYGLECADVLEHQLEVARQRVHDSQRTINKL